MKKITAFLFIILAPILTNAEESIAKFIHEKPIEVADINFYDSQQNIHSLNDYKGKVVLVNFWATWCAPCVEEMPSLSQLKNASKGRDVDIIPISLDYKGVPAVQKFYKQQGIENLEAYIDEKNVAFKSLGLRALPTTLIIDRSGHEVARVYGSIDWNSRAVKDYIFSIVNQ